eukprot:3259834-Amphidinium_carterae.1
MAGSRQLSDFQLGAAMVSIVQPMSENSSPGPWSPSAAGAVGAAFGVDTESVHRPGGALGSTAQPASFPGNVSLTGAARRLESAPIAPVTPVAVGLPYGSAWWAAFYAQVPDLVTARGYVSEDWCYCTDGSGARDKQGSGVCQGAEYLGYTEA